MLRDSRTVSASAPAPLRIFAFAAVLMAAALAAGLRGPNRFNAAGVAQAAPQVAAGNQNNSQAGQEAPFGLRYVPRDALGVFALRPASLAARAAAKPLSDELQKHNIVGDAFGVSVDKIEQATVVFLQMNDPGSPPAGAILRLTADADVQTVIDKLLPEHVEVEYGPHTYLKNTAPVGRPTIVCYRSADRTLIVGESDAHLRRMIAAGESGSSQAPWAAQWSAIANKDIAAYANITSIGAMLDGSLQDAPAPVRAQLAAFQPLWKNATSLTLSANVDDDIEIAAAASCHDAQAADQFSRTLTALVTLGRNSLAQFRQVASRDESGEGLLMLQAFDNLDAMLAQAKITHSANRVEVQIAADARSSLQVVNALAPAVNASRKAARRMQSQNNLKQLGVAMHNYHDTYRKFPPAVVIGPDGKTPHSWRIELLPFLGEQALYDQYRMNEPWDSPHNKQLLAKIPPVFRHPAENPTSTNSSYFALVGPGTIFESSTGTGLPDIIDGTSNTVMFVESKRDIPWTKPADIAFTPGQPIAGLGGFAENAFSAAFCDGAVKSIAYTIDEQVLQHIIQMNDGNPVNLP